MRNLWLVMAAFALLMPSLARSADGDACDTDTGRVTLGSYKMVGCYNVCDASAAADASCDEWDINDAGMPDLFVFEIEDVGADCTDTNGPQVAITTGPTTGGSPEYELDATAVALNDATPRVVIVTKDAPPSRYLFFTQTLDTTCTDIDVRMYLYNRDVN